MTKKISQPLGHMYDNKMLKRNKITKYFVKTLEKLYNFFPFKIVHTDKHFPWNNKTLNKIQKKNLMLLSLQKKNMT